MILNFVIYICLYQDCKEEKQEVWWNRENCEDYDKIWDAVNSKRQSSYELTNTTSTLVSLLCGGTTIVFEIELQTFLRFSTNTNVEG